jgi:hypothetical protein
VPAVRAHRPGGHLPRPGVLMAGLVRDALVALLLIVLRLT